MNRSSKLKLVIRKIVREEVGIAIQEVITELKQPTRQVSALKKKDVGEKQYTSNSVLNDILNETAGSIIPNGSTEEYPTMGNGAYTSDRMEELAGNSYKNIDSDNNGDIIAPGASPEIKNLFDRDFSGILKASMNKSKGKR